MSYRFYMTGTRVFAKFVMLASLGGCASSPEPKVSNADPQQKSAAQSILETEVKPTDDQSSGDSIIFKGICDGSAAIKLEGETILVAYDELNTLFAFSTSGGMPTDRVDLAAMLNLRTSKEIDIEAATISGENIWWVGSHGLNKRGKVRPNRRTLFATNIPSPDLSDIKVITQPLDLTHLLLNSAEVANVLTDDARLKPPKEGGMNIEGLSVSTDGSLVVGFRSPLSGSDGTSGKALVVNLMPKRNTFEVQKVNLLDLGDRGVRDIVIDDSGYKIIAGPVGSDEDFSMYTWNGADFLQQTKSLEGLNAESILDMGDEWLILSDDGKKKRMDEESGRKCDKIRKKKGETHRSVFFRAKLIPK